MKISRIAAPVREQIVSNLRGAIVQGQFKPGQRLIERELCELLGVSRTPLREALRQLETELLIELKPHKGPVVAKVTQKDAQEIYQIRQLLESLACRLFAENASERDIKKLKKSCANLADVIKRGDLNRLLEAKDEFYRILLNGCDNKLVKNMLRSLTTRIAVLRRTSLANPGRPEKSLREIKKIVEAIEKRDPDAAWDASYIHIQKAQLVALAILKNGGPETDGLSRGLPG